MLEFLHWLKDILSSPFFWGLMFIGTSIPQFFIAQRLHHHQVWYAFVPVLKSLQWFQMGKVPTFYLLGLIPLSVVLLFPVLGPEHLQLILFTVKAVIGGSILAYLFFYWFRAATVITVRAGERQSHSVWLLLPVINIFVLGRFALRNEFLVETKEEKKLIDKIIHGVNGDHKLSTLRKYASNLGFERNEFEAVADKALTVKNHSLKVVTDEAYWVHFVNYVIFAVSSFLFLWAFWVGINNLSVLMQAEEAVSKPVQTDESQVSPVSETEEKKLSVPVENTQPDEFVFIMAVDTFEDSTDSIVYGGSILKGGTISQDAKRFYLLDDNYDLLDSVKVQGVSGLFGQFNIRTAFYAEPQRVAYIAETPVLREMNALGAGGEEETNGSVMVITNHDGESTAQNRELMVNIKRDQLEKSDLLYAYDRNLNVIDTAEIIYLLNPQKSSVEKIEAVENVELVLEFNEPYTGEAVFLSPLPELKSLIDYLRLLVS